MMSYYNVNQSFANTGAEGTRSCPFASAQPRVGWPEWLYTSSDFTQVTSPAQVRGDVYEETSVASFVTDTRRRGLEVHMPHGTHKADTARFRPEPSG